MYKVNSLMHQFYRQIIAAIIVYYNTGFTDFVLFFFRFLKRQTWDFVLHLRDFVLGDFVLGDFVLGDFVLGDFVRIPPRHHMHDKCLREAV